MGDRQYSFSLTTFRCDAAPCFARQMQLPMQMVVDILFCQESKILCVAMNVSPCQWRLRLQMDIDEHRYTCSVGSALIYIIKPAGRFSSSPSGKLVQIEYALNAVAAGATSLGIKGTLFNQRQVSLKFALSACSSQFPGRTLCLPFLWWLH